MKLLKNTQSGRSLLSKCGVDEQIFLSDVYKKRTQAKKYQSDATQFGRSMVEMLGVLAIIGVLSVGGIAGYSKAMLKYKINNTLDELSHALAFVIETKAKDQDSYLESVIAKDLGLECEVDENNYCKLPHFGGYKFEIYGIV